MKTVPPERFRAELRAHNRRLIEAVERGIKYRALEVAYDKALSIADRFTVTGTARFGINPSTGRPVAKGHRFGLYRRPTRSRLEQVRREMRFGEPVFMAFHALDARGVYDYAGNDAGRSLENGWSPKARDGVLRPSAEHMRRNARTIVARGLRDAKREMRT